MICSDYEEATLADISRPEFLFLCSYDGSRKIILNVGTYQILRHHFPEVRYVNALFTFTLTKKSFKIMWTTFGKAVPLERAHSLLIDQLGAQ
jgi:hypothetical protein